MSQADQTSMASTTSALPSGLTLRALLDSKSLRLLGSPCSASCMHDSLLKHSYRGHIYTRGRTVHSPPIPLNAPLVRKGAGHGGGSTLNRTFSTTCLALQLLKTSTVTLCVDLSDMSDHTKLLA